MRLRCHFDQGRVGEALTTASGRNFVRLGFEAPGNRASVLDFSGERAAAPGNQPKQASCPVGSRAD